MAAAKTVKGKKSVAKPAKATVKPVPQAVAAKSKLAALKPAKSKMPSADALKAADEGYQLARKDAVKYLHSRRQAMFALGRRYHIEVEDIEQEGFEVLLTCLRDFNPLRPDKDGGERIIQFNTFFGVRLEGKVMELRNRDPEYQARQAHMSDMSDTDKEAFRKDPPLLVNHLDQTTTMQEQLRGEVSSAQRSRQTNLALKIAQDSFVEKKLNQLIAQERDDKRRAALMHVKVGGVSSFDEIAYHFGVTDSRASQILNELMDAFYVQRLLDGDAKNVAYDWRKLKLNTKRAVRLIEDALGHCSPDKAPEIIAAFEADFPEVKAIDVQANASAQSTTKVTGPRPSIAGAARSFSDPFTPEENAKYGLIGLEWRQVGQLSPLGVNFRNPADEPAHGEAPHIATIMDREVDNWPLIVTNDGGIIDGQRRWKAAQTRGKDKLLCLVRDIPTPLEAKTLRVVCNMRQIHPDKMDMYFAIVALGELGLSQQKISNALGISRPNVIVYCKVKDKATSKLRNLFEDGLIQITNASVCVELKPETQDALADFIRRHGSEWSKGPRFNELFEAAAAGKLSKLEAKQPDPAAAEVSSVPSGSLPANVPPPVVADVAVPAADANVLTALRHRQVALEQALKDADIWNQQREGIVQRQTQEIGELKQNIDTLKRELQAHDLLKFGDEATVTAMMKEIKGFYTLMERLVSAAYHIERTGKNLRGQPMSFKQVSEVQEQVDAIEAGLNVIRVELKNKGKRSV